jgi:hypothetical protein
MSIWEDDEEETQDLSAGDESFVKNKNSDADA